MLRGNYFGITVGSGRVVLIAAPAVVSLGITHYGLETPYLAGLWVPTLAGYLLRPETKGKGLEDLADEALRETTWYTAQRSRAPRRLPHG